MPRAAASLFAVVKAVESEFKRWKKEKENNSGEALEIDISGVRRAQQVIAQMDKIFGLFYEVPAEKKDDDTNINHANSEQDGFSVPNDVMELVRSRSAAKDAKDWARADVLRNRITELGFTVKDVKDGTPVVTRIE